MNHPFQKLIYLSERRVNLAEVQLKTADAASVSATSELAIRRSTLHTLSASRKVKREETLSRFIGAPAERLDVSEVIERLRTIDEGIAQAGSAVEEAERKVSRAQAAQKAAMEALQTAELAKERRLKGLAPAIAAEESHREAAWERAQEEEFLNAFGR